MNVDLTIPANRHSPERLLSRYWDIIKWSCAVYVYYIANDRASGMASAEFFSFYVSAWQCPPLDSQGFQLQIWPLSTLSLSQSSNVCGNIVDKIKENVRKQLMMMILKEDSFKKWKRIIYLLWRRLRYQYLAWTNNAFC